MRAIGRFSKSDRAPFNEFLKENCKVEDQQASIAEVQETIRQLRKDFAATITQLTARLDDQASPKSKK